jgi:ubiquinone/menaquinone biosynthesis C-methylase UbiE
LDVRLAFRQLAPLKGRLVLDLGAGLGLHAILLARAGANVVVCDISPNRLREARRLAAEAGVPDGRIRFAVAEAERLPFADAAFGGIFTKSVLIHTDLPRAAGECVRVLSPTGCATFIEPLDRNPFVVLYRLLLAPREWRHITRYFDKLAINELGHPFTKHGFQGTLTPVHYLGFFASIAQFQMESPKMMRAMERVLHRLDRMIFAVFPPFRRYAWFAIFKFSPRKAN